MAIIKALTLSTFDDEGGAARAAFRLHKGLQCLGVRSQMLVQKKFSDDESVLCPESKLAKGISLLRSELDSLPVKFYRQRSESIFSPAFLPDTVQRRISVLNPDIIHLHWVAGGFLRIETLGRFGKPLAWTLHDSWAFTGGCHLPFECTRYEHSCGMCPNLNSGRERDLSRWIWRRKKKAGDGLDIHVVAPSRWLADCAQKSSLFQNLNIRVIPNGLDTRQYLPRDKKTVREFLSLPQDKKLILFGAMHSTGDKNKGVDLLLSAFQRIATARRDGETELIVFGASNSGQHDDFGLKIHYMGRLHDDITLAMLYAAADVFVLPSLQENLPNTIMEALACGTPCVAFHVGGMSDMIEHQRNGYLARPYEIEDLTYGIEWVLSDEKRWQALSQQARQKVENEFDIERVVRRYVDLYQEIVTRSG